MLEAKYYKDYNHNYMILESEDISEKETYQHRMLASNKIDGLLKCSIRDVNGAVYFYYDISSKVSVENLYKGKQLSYEQVRDFFMQMNMLYRKLGQFFMNERGLLVRPDCIYYDMGSKKYFGLYYPDKENQTGNPYEELMDFLLSHIDAGDQRLVDSMYQIYEMSENDNFLLADALQFFEESGETVPDVHNIIEENSIKEKVVGELVDDLASASISEFNNDEDYYSYNDEDENLFLTEDSKKNRFKSKIRNKVKENKQGIVKSKKKNDVGTNIGTKQKGSNKYYGVFAIISLIGICASGFIYFNYKLTKQELMTVICCMALMSLCFVFSLMQFALSGRKVKEKEQEERELQYDIEDEFRDERPVALQEVLDKGVCVGMNLNMNTNMNMPVNKSSQFTAVKQDYSETVFIDTRKQNMEYKLYALDKKNKKHIELTQFPFTIGKMAGCVDCVLTDDSISRLHARIEIQDEKILLTDMNSTNGTYKNGLRMEPSETVELEPGDEIRFGKLNYCYR